MMNKIAYIFLALVIVVLTCTDASAQYPNRKRKPITSERVKDQRTPSKKVKKVNNKQKRNISRMHFLPQAGPNTEIETRKDKTNQKPKKRLSELK